MGLSVQLERFGEASPRCKRDWLHLVLRMGLVILPGVINEEIDASLAVRLG
jgi:hypothetical protein